MSIDLFVHSGNPNTLQDDQLSAKLFERGWHALYVEASGTQASLAGPLSDRVIYGTKTPGPIEEARSHLQSRRPRDFTKFIESSSIAACELTIDPDPDPPEGLDESLPRKLRDLLQATKVVYCLQTSAGRSALSCNLQIAVWEVIGILSGGVLEDPQEPVYFSLTAKGRRRTLWKSDDSPIDVLGIYFRAAKAKGFPVELKESGTNEEVLFHPERLSKTALEQFLAFTQNHRWPDKEYGKGMVGMILDEYKFRKGPAFVRTKAKWLAELEKKYGS